MSSFHSDNARALKKNNRRNAQASKIAEREKADNDYFWQCVHNEEQNRKNGRFKKPSLATQQDLFAKQGTSGINFQQYDAIPVTRSGPDSTGIMQTDNFIDLRSSLPSFLSENLTGEARMNYTNPTPIQRHCIPLSLSGKFDVMACAQTGSGKTVAFLVPLIAHIATSQPGQKKSNTSEQKTAGGRATPAVPKAVVVAPTRELAIQIELEAHKLTFDSDLSCVCVYGGAPTRGQLALLAKGVDILVATPGRLTDFLQRGLIGLGNTKFFVLDEADRMLDMGFEPQIRLDEPSPSLSLLHSIISPPISFPSFICKVN
jgi:ATP-dependent RNA helicase DDX3X